MNRRLFVGQIVAGATCLSIPSSLFARSFSPTLPKSAAITLKNAAIWVQNGSLGSLQHITLSHVYSPERTSLSALIAMVREDVVTVNTLLGTDFVITSQSLLGLTSSEHGSYAAQMEKAGVKLTWQGLARIGVEPCKPVTRLSVYGSKGIIQANPENNDYHLIDFQKYIVQVNNQYL